MLTPAAFVDIAAQRQTAATNHWQDSRSNAANTSRNQKHPLQLRAMLKTEKFVGQNFFSNHEAIF